MRPRTILAVALLASSALIPHCATRARNATQPARQPISPSGQDSEIARSYPELTASAAPEQGAKPAEGTALIASPAPASAVPLEFADPFRAIVRPILSARCGACHDPGGKMYARLPFDDPRVVASHPEGVLRRLKGDDREALQRWFAGLAPAATQQ
jgi:hypothetical protein